MFHLCAGKTGLEACTLQIAAYVVCVVYTHVGASAGIQRANVCTGCQAVVCKDRALQIEGMQMCLCTIVS